jgi:hypothetical protein
MAITKTIEIDVNSNKAESEVKDLIKGFENLNDSVKDLGKTGAKALDNIEKNTKEAEKSTKSLSEGFKATGVAMKAMGVGLIISAFSTLKDVFMSNQKVADTFSAVMGTVTNIFSQVTNVIVSVIEKVNSASGGFKGLSAVISGLLTLSLTPLKVAFYGIKLTIDEVRLAWEESLFGDGDPKTIKDLTKRIEETKGSLKKVGTDAVEAGKKVASNIGTAIGEVGAVVSGTIEGVSKISIAGAYEQAKANVQLQNTAKLAEAEQARLVEQYDRQAEKLRQVRDDDRNSIADRIAANEKLKNVLNNQQAAMLGQANAQIAAAQSTLAQNKSIENQVALTNALANREGVLAQVEGLRSEQQANNLALSKEALDLTKSKNEAETQLAITQKQFDAERLKDEEAILLAQKEALEYTKQAELERLQNVIDTTKAGTQARVDAENEYAAKKQEVENAILLKEDEIAAYKLNKKIEDQQLVANNDALNFQTRLDALTEQERLITEATNISEAERTALLKANAEARTEIATKEKEARLKLMDAVSSGLSMAAGELGEATAAGKAAAVAAATISTYTAIAGQLQAFSKVPVPGYAIAQAIVTGAMGLLQVKKILEVKTPEGGGGGSAPSMAGGGGAAAMPSFNVVGAGGTNQIAQVMSDQGAAPVQAYVVASNVTSAQSLNRNIVNNATLG